jgi:carboxyl-terminal processing protease
VGESTRESALPWDRIPGVRFEDEVSLAPAVTQLARTHETRSSSDPDFRTLLGDVAAFDKLRKQTAVSLNLKARQVERDQLDQERLTRENQRRAAHGQKALTSLEELDESTTVDAVLAEAAQIVADMTTLPLIAQAFKDT